MREFNLFLLSGGVAAALNYGSRFVFSALMPFELAVVAAYVVGMLTAFVLMRTVVFQGRGKPLGPQMSRFALVNIAALLQTFVISVVLAKWALPMVGVTTHAEAIGHLVGVIFPAFTSYLGHRHLTFR